MTINPDGTITLTYDAGGRGDTYTYNPSTGTEELIGGLAYDQMQYYSGIEGNPWAGYSSPSTYGYSVDDFNEFDYTPTPITPTPSPEGTEWDMSVLADNLLRDLPDFESLGLDIDPGVFSHKEFLEGYEREVISLNDANRREFARTGNVATTLDESTIKALEAGVENYNNWVEAEQKRQAGGEIFDIAFQVISLYAGGAILNNSFTSWSSAY